MKLKRKVHGKKREIVEFLSINLYKMETMLEEEKITEIVTALVTGQASITTPLNNDNELHTQNDKLHVISVSTTCRRYASSSWHR